MSIKIITAFFITYLFISCNSNDKKADNNSDSAMPIITTPLISYNPINIYPHDTSSYTEGFLVHESNLYESTGHTDDLPQTKSLFGVVNLKTGKIDIKAELDKKKYFGEGIVFIKDKIYQLTYTTKIGFIYNAKTFQQTGTFTYPSKEGWGMTTDSANIIMSDGTTTLTWLDPTTFKVIKTIIVKDEKGPVSEVNELEYIKGFIYANVYTTGDIIKIDPSSGKVVGRLDLSNLVTQEKNQYPGAKEMNGIAYDYATDKIYITGKMWPHIYELKFEH